MTRRTKLQRALTGALVLAALVLPAAPAVAPAPANPFDYERASSFTYKADGLLESETVEPDKPALCVTTRYNYDDYDDDGNKTGAKTAPCAANGGKSKINIPPVMQWPTLCVL